MAYGDYAQITASYASGCFCERPELGKSEPVPMIPTFQFMKAARRLADALGVENVKAGRTTDRTAMGELRVPCRHRATQYVRFDWTLS